MDSQALRYGRILRHVYATPWAIQGRRLADIMDVLHFQSHGGKLTPDEVAEYVDIRAAGPRTQGIEGGIQVLSLRGILSHRIEAVNDISGPGGTSTEQFSARLANAMADNATGAIIIDIDSPGGAVDGVAELSAQVREARAAKPVIAVANTLAASAAYWVAAQASELVMTPSAEVGSIGVFAAHRDISEQLAMEGEKVTLVHAGKYKVEGNPYEPLGDEAREEIQRKVNSAYSEFVDDVAAGRGVASSVVRSDYGQGRTLNAREAVAAGMADRVETMNEVISRLQGQQASRRRRAHADRERRLAFV